MTGRGQEVLALTVPAETEQAVKGQEEIPTGALIVLEGAFLPERQRLGQIRQLRMQSSGPLWRSVPGSVRLLDYASGSGLTLRSTFPGVIPSIR